MFTYDCSIESILHQQYFLSRHANILISDSESMSDADREIYYKMLINDIKEEQKQFS
jgi:hypothetical protein